MESLPKVTKHSTTGPTPYIVLNVLNVLPPNECLHHNAKIHFAESDLCQLGCHFVLKLYCMTLLGS